jgi:hypothetical protein
VSFSCHFRVNFRVFGVIFGRFHCFSHAIFDIIPQFSRHFPSAPKAAKPPPPAEKPAATPAPITDILGPDVPPLVVAGTPAAPAKQACVLRGCGWYAWMRLDVAVRMVLKLARGGDY